MAAKEQIYSRYVGKRGTKERVTKWADVLSTMLSVEGKPEALEGVLVLDLSYANYCGVIMASFFAEAGAEVIKVEPPQGDPARLMAPHGASREGVGSNYLMESRNKRHLCLDLQTEQGRANLLKLAAQADVLIETAPPGEFDAMGIGYRQLREINPGLIYVAISPYGHFRGKGGKWGQMPWSDLTSQAESGMAAVIGGLPTDPEPFNWPTRAGFFAAGYSTAVEAATGALAALMFRHRTGQGQMIDVAAADAFSSCVGVPPTFGYVWKKSRVRYGALDYGLSPYGFFKCKDAHLAIACFRDQDFRAAIKVLGLWKIEEDWRTILDRITDDFSRVRELNEDVEKAVAGFTYDELFERFSKYASKVARSKWRGGGLPVTTKMLSPAEAAGQKHWQKRDVFVEAEHARYGTFVLPLAGKLSDTPLRIKWVSVDVGEDNQYIFDKYGLNPQ